jgi:hypothetical protein
LHGGVKGKVSLALGGRAWKRDAGKITGDNFEALRKRGAGG